MINTRKGRLNSKRKGDNAVDFLRLWKVMICIGGYLSFSVLSSSTWEDKFFFNVGNKFLKIIYDNCLYLSNNDCVYIFIF